MDMLENRLKSCREELEMTQTELGYVFGVTKQTVSNWENGNDIIPLKKLVRFCNLYHFPIDYVIGLQKIKKDATTFKKINKKNIGAKLKEKRKELGLSQQYIADECSISQTTYSNYELGINLITTSTLFTICKNHKISMEYFLDKKMDNLNT